MHIFGIFLIFSLCGVALSDNSCIFHHSTHGTIELTSLGLQNNHARFQNLSSNSSSSYIYSFNPCFSFTEDHCHNVAVCQTSANRMYSFPLALQNSSQWTIDSSNTPILTYNYGIKTVSISMMCWSLEQHLVEILEENPANHYSMRLFSHCACWNGCKTSPSTTSTTPQPVPSTTNVIYSSACRYRDSRYGTIDLSSIGSMTGTPAFQDFPTVTYGQYVWSYNPCYKFSEMNCQNVSGCQIDRSQNSSYTIGLQDYAFWINMNPTEAGIQSIVYPSPSTNRQLTVQLICDRAYSSPRLVVLGETSTGEYTMQLTSRCACWNECTDPTPDPDSFDSSFWIILGSICLGVFLLCCIMITCLFCSKPKRRYPMIISDEKTLFYPGSRKH